MEKKTNIENPNEKALVDLTNGHKQPETDFEKDLQKDIDKIKNEGRVVEIPSDI